jgi:PKD repeat protein
VVTAFLVAVGLAAVQVVFAAPPTGDFTISNAAPRVGDTVTFTPVNVTDPDSDPIEITWDFSYNGTTFTPDPTGDPPATSYATAGPRTVAMRVTDGTGGGDLLITHDLTVQGPPTASFTATPTAPQVGQTVNFDGSDSSDPDGGAIETYEWDLDGNGSFETNTGATPTASSSYDTPGPIDVQLRVTDDDGELSPIAIETVTVQEPANVAPTASFVATPARVQVGQTINFDGSGSSDSDGTIATYEWDLDGDGSFETVETVATGGDAVTSRLYTSPDPSITVRLRVTDDDGATSEAIQTVRVDSTPVPNLPPQASFRVSPASPFTGDVVTLSSTSSDPDGPLVSQDWDTDNDGQFDDASGPVASRSFPSAGGQTVRLRVVDGNGASAIAVGRVDVRARLIPPPPPPPPPPPLTVLDSNVTISGRFSNSSTTIGRLIVKAPAGAQIAPACKGRGCPKRVKKLRAKAAAKRVRVRAFERRWRPGAKITIRVTKPGFIGTHTQFKIRRGKRPKRIELCVQPAAKRASACPQS